MSFPIPSDFPLDGLRQLLEMANLKNEDRADDICLKLKQAITATAEQAIFVDINDASLDPDDPELIAIRYLNIQNNWVSFSFRPDELRRLAATSQSDTSDHRPTHG